MRLRINTNIFMFACILMMACTTESADSDIIDQNNQEGVVGILPELIDGNENNVTRNSLHYDYTEKRMLFTWDITDKIGVFQQGATGGATQIPFDIIPASINGLSARFQAPNDANFNFVAGEEPKNYISYSAYNASFYPATHAVAYPVSYVGQRAQANAKMKFYFTSDYDNFTTSEKEAARHLSAYDVLVSNPTPPTSETNAKFSFNRMGAVTRFYLKAPEAEVFDSLQLVVVPQKDQTVPSFTLKGTLSMETQTITPTITNRIQTLEFNAFDMTFETRDGTTNNYPVSDYYYKNTGYIVTYMMLAPVDLTNAADLYLYLISHDGSGNKKYYKSATLLKPKLTPNMFYQWTSANQTPADPIEFSEITIQDWEDDVLGNDNGKGTEGW